jgi:hypothetical protein
MNSLYGKFGMTPYLPHHLIINQEEIAKYQNNDKYDVIEIKPFSENKVIISILNDSINNFKINISIASAITSYARMFMSQFLADPKLNIYYIDTDSIDVDTPLDEIFIGKELGKFKLEFEFIEAIFLAPKVYGGSYLKNLEIKEISKIKGFKNQVPLNLLKTLLIKNESLPLNNEKWFRNIFEGDIQIKDQIYNLVVTNNKRKLKYINNSFVDTEPYIINENKEIINKD